MSMVLKPKMAFIGVRISWLTLAMNCSRKADARNNSSRFCSNSTRRSNRSPYALRYKMSYKITTPMINSMDTVLVLNEDLICAKPTVGSGGVQPAQVSTDMITIEARTPANQIKPARRPIT